MAETCKVKPFIYSIKLADGLLLLMSLSLSLFLPCPLSLFHPQQSGAPF
jgi:hypothetical protein